MEDAFYKISMSFYNKNVLEYAQIAQSGLKSMIRNIEGSQRCFLIQITFLVKVVETVQI